MISDFEKKYPFEKRLIESQNLKSRYPSRVPIIIYPVDDKQPKIEKTKFLVPDDLTFSQFLFTVKKYLECTKEQAIFVFTHDNNLIPNNWLMSELQKNYKKEDNFVYLFYSLENTFG